MSWYRRAYRKLFRKEDLVALFVPLASRGGADAVAAFLEIFSRLKRVPRQLVLNEYTPHFNDVLRQLGHSSVPHTIVLFAHPSNSGSGFAVNPSDNVRGRTLLLRWWKFEGESTTYRLVAHVCRGAEILRRERWGEVFPEWISFEKDLKVFLGSASAREKWRRILKGTIDIPFVTDSLGATRLRIEAMYQEIMADTLEDFKGEEGDALTLMYLQDTLESMASAEAA